MANEPTSGTGGGQGPGSQGAPSSGAPSTGSAAGTNPAAGPPGGAKVTRLDPMPVFVFRLTLTLADFNQGTALFKSIGGLKYETEVVDVRVGGRNDTTIKLPGSTKWNNIVLKRGFTQDFKLIKWREDWMTGRQRVRCDGTIYQLNHSLGEVCAWSFKRGWPCKWEISEYDASKNEIAIETLEIAHEGLTFDPNPAEKAAK